MTTPPEDSSTPEASDAPKDDVSGNPAPEASPPKKKIDPWHFGAHTVPPQLRAELSAMTLPESPEERRYRRPNAEAAADSPAPPVDTSRADPTVMIPRVAKRRDKRVVVGIVIGVALLLLLVAALSRGTGGPANTAAESPTTKPSTAVNVPPTKPTAASANPNPAGTTAAVAPPTTSSPVTAPITPPDQGGADNSKHGSRKPSATSRPAAPAQGKPATPAPASSPAPRASSGRLIPADD